MQPPTVNQEAKTPRPAVHVRRIWAAVAAFVVVVAVAQATAATGACAGDHTVTFGRGVKRRAGGEGGYRIELRKALQLAMRM